MRQLMTAMRAPLRLREAKEIRPEFSFGDNHEFGTQGREVRADGEGEVQRVVKDVLRAETLGGEFLAGAGGGGNQDTMRGKFLP
jgi:hypothetical protein